MIQVYAGIVEPAQMALYAQFSIPILDHDSDPIPIFTQLKHKCLNSCS